MKRILIISVSAGAGHVRAADALQKQARICCPDVHTEHIDMVKYVSLPMKKTAIDSYAIMAKKVPKMWGFLYERTDNPKITARFNKLTKQMKRINSVKLYEYIEEFEPDLILCTHFLASDIILNAPRDIKTNAPVVTVITDYDLHSLWIVPGTYHYFVACDKIKWKMKYRGIADSQITASGIPTDPIFFEKKDVHELRKKYFVADDRKVILVLSGGHGLGNAQKIVKGLFELDNPVNIIAIAGKNKKLENKLKSLKTPNHIRLDSIGWTEKMDEFMRLADIIITKPGGITTTECTALGKYIIATEPIPGQEDHNANYILENGHGSIAYSAEDIMYYTNRYLYPKTEEEKNFVEFVHKRQKKPRDGANIILEEIRNILEK